MSVLTLYFSKEKTLPRSHQALRLSGEIVGYIRVKRSTGRVTPEHALDHAQPERGEVVLNTVEGK